MPGSTRPCFSMWRTAAFAGQPGLRRLRRVVGADRAEFRHAPAMLDRDAELVAERLDQQRRRGRAAGHDALHRRQLLAAGAQMLQQAEPDGRHAAGHRHALLVEQPRQAGAVQVPARQHQRRAGQRRGVGNAPGIDVEHRHDRQDARWWRAGPARRAARSHRRAAPWSGGCTARPSAARWCPRCSTARSRCSRRTSARRSPRPPRPSVRRSRAGASRRQLQRRHAGRVGHHHDGAHAVLDPSRAMPPISAAKPGSTNSTLSPAWLMM